MTSLVQKLCGFGIAALLVTGGCSAATPLGVEDPKDSALPTSPGPRPTHVTANSNSTEQSRLHEFTSRLQSIPGVTLSEALPPRAEGDSLCARLAVPVPRDHRSAEPGTLTVDVQLCESNPLAPVGLLLTGYGLDPALSGPPAPGTNTITVSQRFADGEVRAQDLPFVTGWQAASDVHFVHDRLTYALGWQRLWFVQGSSKGGMSALFYRYYYPQDSLGVLALSAQVNPGNRRAPYAEFVRSGGDLPQCFAKIRDLQRRMFSQEAEFLPVYLPFSSVGLGAIFDDTAAEYEHIVASLPTFVMRNADPASACAALPSAGASPREVIVQVLEARGGRERLTYEDGWAVESAAYLGWADLYPVDEELRSLMSRPEILGLPLVPKSEPRPSYRSDETLALWRWLETQATRVLFVDGANDVIAANRPEPDERREIWHFVAPRGGHGGFDTMPAEDSRQIEEILDRWEAAP